MSRETYEREDGKAARVRLLPAASWMPLLLLFLVSSLISHARCGGSVLGREGIEPRRHRSSGAQAGSVRMGSECGARRSDGGRGQPHRAARLCLPQRRRDRFHHRQHGKTRTRDANRNIHNPAEGRRPPLVAVQRRGDARPGTTHLGWRCAARGRATRISVVARLCASAVEIRRGSVRRVAPGHDRSHREHEDGAGGRSTSVCAGAGRRRQRGG